MESTLSSILLAALLWLAVVCQGSLAHTINIRGVQPDFPLVVLSCGSILVGGVGGTWLGFWAGLLAAVSFPQAYGSLFFSRIAAGAFAGSVGQNLIRDNILVPSLVTIASTLLAEMLTALLAPGYVFHHLRHWVSLTCGELCYNALLAIPVFLFLRGIRVGQVTEDYFGRPLS